MSILRAGRFLIMLGFRIDRVRLARAVVLMLTGYAAAPLAALALAQFTEDGLRHHFGAMLWLAAAAASLLVAQLMLSHFAHLDYFELAEMQEIRLRTELVDLVNRPSGMEHLENPAFADNVNLVREALVISTRALEALLQLAGLVLQTVITMAILIALSPWLALLPLTAVPSVLLARKAWAITERAREITAELTRLSSHLITVATDSSAVKEVRIFGSEHELLRRQAAAWQLITEVMCREQAKGAALRAVGRVTFALGYGGAILLLVRQAVTGPATIGDLVLVITLAVQVSTQIASSVQQLILLQSAGSTADRISSLRAMLPPPVPPENLRSSPTRLRQGIALEHLSFHYPGAEQPVLQDVCLDIRAGQTLALVGENGAGKSTLVKLLCGLYTPTGGRIVADGIDLAYLDPAEWRAKIATLFQDFYRFELTLREGIGLGDVNNLRNDAAVALAVRRARAERVVKAVPGGFDGYTGRAYDQGVQLSGGEWQLIGLARCMMRTHPLLLILDEPAAALDATAEHALFEHYASSASAAAREHGGITILISHRFSTVLMADQIAVLSSGRLVEHGTHDELIARAGTYAELFKLQAKAYQ